MDDSSINDETPLLTEVENTADIGVVIPHSHFSANLRKSVDDLLINCDESLNDIIAVFVVSFDTRSGNLLEWCFPQDADLRGIEFKALVSGAHKVKTDFIYFKQCDQFGLACFENMPVQSNLERGARMKSVGILSLNYRSLYQHFDFLRMQVRILLENPGSYDQLLSYYDCMKIKNDLKINYSDVDSISSLSTPTKDLMNSMDSFKHFIDFFGENIFTLWKLVLLQKRLLFFSPPPIGVVCYRVFCASCMSNHSFHQINHEISQPLFSINLNDIHQLAYEQPYIACTSEKVFEIKKDLYDAYIDNQNIEICNRQLKDTVKITNTDRKNFQQLKNKCERVLSNSSKIDLQSCFTSFFSGLNDKIFDLLLNISQTDHRQLTSSHIKSIGLDPSSDRKFIIAVIELYNFDVVYVSEGICCPCCPDYL